MHVMRLISHDDVDSCSMPPVFCRESKSVEDQQSVGLTASWHAWAGLYLLWSADPHTRQKAFDSCCSLAHNVSLF